MAGISIPGVSDKYNTSSTIEKLMEVERIPLNREQETLKTYQSQQNAWRDMNMKLSTLRESVRSLYSFDSPFQSKLAESSNDGAVTAEATNGANFGSFSVEVVKLATADRFLSDEIDAGMKVDAGTYVFKSGDKSVSLKWNGGKLQDFVTAFNRRGDKTFKASIINSGNKKNVLLIESLKTGLENKISFEKDAEAFAKNIGMIGVAPDSTTVFGMDQNDIGEVPASTEAEQTGMPELAAGNVTEEGIVLAPRSSISIAVPENVRQKGNDIITFTISAAKTDDITEEINAQPPSPVLPDAGSATFEGLTISNFQSDTTVPFVEALPEPLVPVETEKVVYAVAEDGSEILIPTANILDSDEGTNISINMADYPNISHIVIKNRNTAEILTVSQLTASDPATKDGLAPLNAISTADDATIRYEGITMRRPTNKIDDIVPNVTLNISDVTEKPATITVKSDSENAKDALITFVGKYNQAVAEINVLTQNKPELINELTYLTDDEQEALREKLGMFQGDFTLSNIKTSMQNIVTSSYPFGNPDDITLLAQLGISSNSVSGAGYNASRLRGYLEIDEKKLDAALSENMENVRKLFGYDSNGDMVIDSGIGYKLDQQIAGYTQSNGIISTKTNTINGQIRSSEQRISKLETQLAAKEQQLKQQFGQMEGALNSLEANQNRINNFMQQNSNNNR